MMEWNHLLEDSEKDWRKPSENVKHTIFQKTISRKCGSTDKKRRGGTVLAAAILCIATALPPLLNTEQENSIPGTSTLSFLHEPGTNLYTSTSAVGTGSRGYVWVNDVSGEVYVFVENLNKDNPEAQVHTQNNEVISIGSMNAKEQGGQVYSHKEVSDEPEYLVVKSIDENDVEIFPLDHFLDYGDLR
ncbi:hypothetical protein [Salibacterium sp. K-3]